MTYYCRTETQTNKIANWNDLNIGDYFWESDLNVLCIKITSEKFYNLYDKKFVLIDECEMSCICEVNAKVIWEMVYEKEN